MLGRRPNVIAIVASVTALVAFVLFVGPSASAPAVLLVEKRNDPPIKSDRRDVKTDHVDDHRRRDDDKPDDRKSSRGSLARDDVVVTKNVTSAAAAKNTTVSSAHDTHKNKKMGTANASRTSADAGTRTRTAHSRGDRGAKNETMEKSTPAASRASITNVSTIHAHERSVHETKPTATTSAHDVVLIATAHATATTKNVTTADARDAVQTKNQTMSSTHDSMHARVKPTAATDDKPAASARARDSRVQLNTSTTNGNAPQAEETKAMDAAGASATETTSNPRDHADHNKEKSAHDELDAYSDSAHRTSGRFRFNQ